MNNLYGERRSSRTSMVKSSDTLSSHTKLQQIPEREPLISSISAGYPQADSPPPYNNTRPRQRPYEFKVISTRLFNLFVCFLLKLARFDIPYHYHTPYNELIRAWNKNLEASASRAKTYLKGEMQVRQKLQLVSKRGKTWQQEESPGNWVPSTREFSWAALFDTHDVRSNFVISISCSRSQPRSKKTALSIPNILPWTLRVASHVVLGDGSKKSSEKPTGNRSYNERDAYDTRLVSSVESQLNRTTTKLKNPMQVSEGQDED